MDGGQVVNGTINVWFVNFIQKVKGYLKVKGSVLWSTKGLTKLPAKTVSKFGNPGRCEYWNRYPKYAHV